MRQFKIRIYERFHSSVCRWSGIPQHQRPNHLYTERVIYGLLAFLLGQLQPRGIRPDRHSRRYHFCPQWCGKIFLHWRPPPSRSMQRSEYHTRHWREDAESVDSVTRKRFHPTLHIRHRGRLSVFLQIGRQGKPYLKLIFIPDVKWKLRPKG